MKNSFEYPLMDKQRSFFMKKIKSSIDRKLLVGFLAKVLLLGTGLLVILSALVSFAVYKLDIDSSLLGYFSIAVVALSAFGVAFFCAKPFKNNGFLIGVVSAFPIMIFSTVNLIVNSNNVGVFFIKLIVCVLVAGLSGAYSVKKSKKIRVKK